MWFIKAFLKLSDVLQLFIRNIIYKIFAIKLTENSIEVVCYSFNYFLRSTFSTNQYSCVLKLFELLIYYFKRFYTWLKKCQAKSSSSEKNWIRVVKGSFCQCWVVDWALTGLQNCPNMALWSAHLYRSNSYLLRQLDLNQKGGREERMLRR